MQAEVRALARRMLRKRSRDELVEGAYNKYAFHDAGLPRWFEEDQRRHSRCAAPLPLRLPSQPPPSLQLASYSDDRAPRVLVTHCVIPPWVTSPTISSTQVRSVHALAIGVHQSQPSAAASSARAPRVDAASAAPTAGRRRW